MPRFGPPLGTIWGGTSPSRNGLSRQPARRAQRPAKAPIRRGATCVDEALNNGFYRQAYPGFSPQLSVAVRRQADCANAAPGPAWRRRWGEVRGLRGVLIPPRVPRPRAGFARPCEGSQRGLAGLGRGRSRANHAAGAGALRAQARAHAAFRARAPLAPMGGAPGRRPRTASPRSARVGAAVHQGRQRGVRVRRAPVPGFALARSFGYQCSRGGGGRELFNEFGRRPPDASRIFRAPPRRRALPCGKIARLD